MNPRPPNAVQRPPASRRPDRWGIAPGYWITMSPATRTAINEAMGVKAGTALASTDRFVRVVTVGEAVRFPGPGELILEDGSQRAFRNQLPTDTPPGYHTLAHAGADNPAPFIGSRRPVA